MEAQRIANLDTFIQLVRVQIQDSNLDVKRLRCSVNSFHHS